MLKYPVIMKREQGITTVSPGIGHGNPATALAIAQGLNTKPLIFDGTGVICLRLAHQGMTQVEGLSRLYSEGSEKARGGLGMLAIGLLQLHDFLKSAGIISQPLSPYSDIGIFTQEHLLGVLPAEILTWWFPRGVFLYVPDVYPKASAVAILERLRGVVTPLVWNSDAYEEIKRKGLNPRLVTPVLPFGLIEEKKAGELDPSKVVVKSSGSGIPASFLEAIEKSRKEGQKMEIWLPKVKITVSDQGREEENTPQNIGDYLSSFYQSLLNVGTIICGPSEMVQVIVALNNAGWQGEVILLPPRGKHEVRNREWLIKVAREANCVVEEEVDFNEIKATRIDFSGRPGCFRNRVGERSINEAIEELANRR